jgi:TolB-like protein/DNA-binding SARP family transcriptional activator
MAKIHGMPVLPGATAVDDHPKIHLFGAFQCRFADGVDFSPRLRKSRGVLAFLALARGRPIPRSRIAGILWDLNTEEQARSNLRQAIRDLSASFPKGAGLTIEANRNEVRLDAAAYWCDLALFEPGGATDDPGINGPTGVLLDDLDGLSGSFDHFLASERARIDQMRLRWHETRLDRAERRAPDERIAVARALLAVDQTHERAWRVVIGSQAALGDLGSALQEYRACQAALLRLLDARPAPETQALIEEIQRIRPGKELSSLKPAAFAAPVHSAGTRAEPERSFPLSPSALDAPSVAVLPLRWLGPDAEEPWLSEGISEDIVCILSGMREPVVISSHSSRWFSNPAQSLQSVAGQLGADYLVTGSVRMSSGRVKLSLSLETGASGASLWRESYQTHREELFDLQAEIAARIAHSLAPRVQASELRRSLRQKPEDLSAYHMLLRAREKMFRLTRADFDEAGDLLRRAVALDPGYASAHGMLANWHLTRLFQGWSDDLAVDREMVDSAALTALRLDPDHARTLAMLGHRRAILNRRFDEALPMLDRAFERAPNDAEALCWSVPTLSYAGRTQEAIARARKVIALSPQDPIRFQYEHYLSLAYYANDDFEEAVRWGESSIALNQKYTASLRTTVAAMVAIGKTEEAKKYVEIINKLPITHKLKNNYSGPPYKNDEKRKEFLNQMTLAGISF